jgi:7-cyano-7-deazaguanine synthase
MTEKALVLFSGGQDSTTCLAWALEKYDYVETIGFDYGQRHSIEMECRLRTLSELKQRFPGWTKRLGKDQVINLGFISEVSETALTSDTEIKMLGNGLPSTFVPGRNLFFLSVSAAVAYRAGIDALVGGMCETDYSGYPDCRDEFVKSAQMTIQKAMDSELIVETPLMWLDKAQTWELSDELGGQSLVELIVEETHTCYRGDRSVRHEWGYGCDDCFACEIRSAGWIKYESSHN